MTAIGLTNEEVARDLEGRPRRRMGRIRRNTNTAASRAFWADCIRVARIVRRWPDWKRAGINVTDRRLP